MSEQRLRINAENVVHEEVDGEVIAIDLGGGSYYSLAGSAPAIWAMLGDGASASEICAALAASFDAEDETIREAVEGLLAKLRESELVVVTDEATERQPVVGNGERTPFEPTRFESYDDMQDYFLLDPIHEVDTAGWPRPAA